MKMFQRQWVCKDNRLQFMNQILRMMSKNFWIHLCKMVIILYTIMYNMVWKSAHKKTDIRRISKNIRAAVRADNPPNGRGPEPDPHPLQAWVGARIMLWWPIPGRFDARSSIQNSSPHAAELGIVRWSETWSHRERLPRSGEFWQSQKGEISIPDI